MYYSLEQICKRLHKNERQIRYMVNQGRLHPVNQDTYRRDGGYRFSEEEIQRVEQMLDLPGLTVKEASRELEITPQYLLQFVSKGTIESEVKWIGKKKRRFFQKEEINRFKSQIKEGDHAKRTGEYGVRLPFISREVRIFEECLHDGLHARIVGLEPIKLLKENGETIELEETEFQSTDWPDHPYIRTKGHVEFEIPIPRHPQHPVYKLLYHIIEQLGVKNVQIYETELGDYHVRCRLGAIHASHKEYKLLQKYITSGEMSYDEGIVQFLSSEITKTITVPRSVWERLENYPSGYTMNEIVTKALENYVKKKEL